MKSQLKRIKELIYYPKLLSEEMIISKEFNEGSQKDEQNKVMYIKISEDPDDNETHYLDLIIRFDKSKGYNELIYYFLVSDVNNKTVKTIYKRDEAKQYIPKQLQNQRIFVSKINEMFKKLIEMEKPDIFFIELYEDLEGESLKRINNIRELILKSGYNITGEGINKLTGRQYWRFSEKTKQEIKESGKEFVPTPLTEEDWQRIGEETMKGIVENEKRKKNL